MRCAVYCPKSEFAVSPVDIGFSSDRRITRFGPGKRDQYIIHYVTKGEGFFCTNKVRAGQGFLITPGMLEEYHSSENDPWTFLWIVAYGGDMEKLFRKCRADEKSGIFTYGFAAQLEAMFDYFVKNDGRTLGILEMTELFYKIFSHHDRTSERSTLPKNSRIYLDYAAEMIGREYSRSITVSEICEKLGISEPYLFRLFKNEFGKSPKRYISDLRITQSKILLSETDMSITEIGCAVGYDDVLAFSRFFAAETGKAPSLYRAENMHKKE